MKDNPLQKLETLGQSIWLDYIRCDLIASGDLRRLIEEDGLRGMTSNPFIFEKAIAESNIYDQVIHDLAFKKKDAKANITEKLESDGVEKFIKSFDKLIEALIKKSFA
jgi:transaldolase